MYNSQIPTNAETIKDLTDTVLSNTSDEDRSVALLSIVTGLKRQPSLASAAQSHIESLYLDAR